MSGGYPDDAVGRVEDVYLGGAMSAYMILWHGFGLIALAVGVGAVATVVDSRGLLELLAGLLGAGGLFVMIMSSIVHSGASND